MYNYSATILYCVTPIVVCDKGSNRPGMEFGPSPGIPKFDRVRSGSSPGIPKFSPGPEFPKLRTEIKNR